MHEFFNGSGHGNVRFSVTHDVATDLAAYARGYHRAGKWLATRLAEANGYPDYDGYPILFAYRHSLELFLKAFVYRGAQYVGFVSDDECAVDRLFHIHRLSAFLPAVGIILKHLDWEWAEDIPGLRSSEDFKALLNGIDSVDGQSYAFRYPTNTKGAEHLPRETLINVVRFASCMDAVLESLDAAMMGLEFRRDRITDLEVVLQKLYRNEEL